MKILLVILSVMYGMNSFAQTYFPPTNSEEWETTSPESLDWCGDKIDSLYAYLETNQTKAFILLKDGKIVLEQYFGNFKQENSWYWASAGKTLTAALVGIAQDEELLAIEDKTSEHLGVGWTNCVQEKEDLITVRHQLTMTTGLDDGVVNQECTLPECLEYISDAGTRWAYHNAPYTLLGSVIEKASGVTLNQYAENKLLSKIGMNGIYINFGYNRIFSSSARSMARFGLLILNNGDWDDNAIIKNKEYVSAMTVPSQDINQSYGYLWWLNGQDSYMLPQSQVQVPGSLFPQAPEDMFAALGKNGQFITVIPSQNMVWIRMGNAPTDVNVPFLLNDAISQRISKLNCNTVSTQSTLKTSQPILFPNPARDKLFIAGTQESKAYSIYDSRGDEVLKGECDNFIDISTLQSGIYSIVLKLKGDVICEQFVVL